MTQYNGGKKYTIKRHGMGAFLARYLAAREPRRFVDGMCGSGSVAVYVATLDLGIEVVANDAHPAITCLLRRVGEGWDPPDELSETAYAEIKNRALASARHCPACVAEAQVAAGIVGSTLPIHTCAAAHDPLVGFAGFAVSFGGKYFGGYGGRPRPAYMRPVEGAAKMLREERAALSRVTILTGDYRTLPARIGVRAGDAWYFDKPYRGTEQYKGVPGNGCACGTCPKAKGGPLFCDSVFWSEAHGISHLADSGRVDVLVSEFEAPAPWSPIWSVTRRQEMRDGHNGQEQTGRADSVYVLPHTLADLGAMS